MECYKRALIPADPHEITINLKLAKIHRTLEEHSEAVAYHRRVVEVCQADRKPISNILLGTPTHVSHFVLCLSCSLSVRPIQDYAKSSLEVADYEMRIPDGNLNLAKQYLDQVAASNAEDVGRAKELLKTVNGMIYARTTLTQESINKVDT